MDEHFEGTVTVLFTDVVGSTALTNRRGDAAGRALLRDSDNLIREHVAHHGGREVKALGDGLMVAFPSARRAMSCAVEIQRALEKIHRSSGNGLRIRMGLNAGEAIHEDDDLFGSAVNAAARIAEVAGGGEILVSEVVKALAGRVPDIDYVDRGEVELKGFDEGFRLFEVCWKRELRALRPFERTPFVSRDKELAELCSFLEDLERGRGGVVLIGGEPGVGKTRLTEEIMEEARRREHRVLVGHCYESETAPPYIPFVEIIESAMREVEPETLRAALGDAAGEVAKIVPQIRNMFDDVPPPLELPAEQERRYLLNSLWEFIERAASIRPLILVLDDVHWADGSTLLTAEHIAQRLEQIPVLVLATYRDTELEVTRPLARTVETLVRQQHAHRLSLKRLPHQGVRSLLQVMSGQEPPPELVTAIFEETDGNPFFAEELFKHLSEEGKLFDESGRWRKDLEIDELDVPEGVKLVIGRRLARLDRSTLIALGIAAQIGRRFEYRVVEAVGEISPDQLLDAMDQAEAARLIVSETESGDPIYSFAHELIRQTLLSSTALPRRQRRHLAIAGALQELHVGDLEAHAADIAAHLLQGGSGADQLETARFLRLAGRRALDAAAFEEGLRHYENALALHPDEKSVDYAELLFEHGLALRTRNRFEEAFTAWRQAIALLEAAGEYEATGRICREISLQLGWIGRAPEGVEWAARGLVVTRDLRNNDRADLLALMGGAMSWLGEYEEGPALIDQGIELAHELGDPETIGRALGARSLHHFFYMDLEESIAYGERAAPYLRGAGAMWEVATFLPMNTFAYLGMGRFDEADRLSHEMLALSDRLGHQVGSMLSTRAAELRRGTIDPSGVEAKARADIASNLDNDLGWVSNGYMWLGAALTWQGRWDGALEGFRNGLQFEVIGAFNGWATGFLAMHLARMGRTQEVLDLIERNRSTFAVAGRPHSIGITQMTLSFLEAAWLVELDDLCASLYPLVQETLARNVTYRVFDFRSYHTLGALACDAAGDDEGAERHLDAALEGARSAPVPVEEADICLFRARMLSARGGRDTEVVELLGRAEELTSSMGMQTYLELMKQRLLSVVPTTDVERGES